VSIDDDKLGGHIGRWLELLPPEAATIVVRLAGPNAIELPPLASLALPASNREQGGGDLADLVQEFADTQGRVQRLCLVAESKGDRKAPPVVLRMLPLRIRPDTTSATAEASAPRVSDKSLETMLAFSQAQMGHIERLHELGFQSRDGIMANVQEVMKTDRERIRELATETTQAKALAQAAQDAANAAFAEAEAVINAVGQAGGPPQPQDEFKSMFKELAKEFFLRKFGVDPMEEARKATEAEAQARADADARVRAEAAERQAHEPEPEPEPEPEHETPPPTANAGGNGAG